MADRLVIVDGVRTPFSKMGTDLARLGAADLARAAISDLMTRSGFDPEAIDEVILGCVGQPVDAMNIARVAALRAGLPERIPAVTVHRNCASGMESITQAYEKACAGRGEVFVVGGTESMSNYPLLYSESAKAKFMRLARARSFGQRLATLLSFRLSDFSPIIGLKEGLTDSACGLNMGQTAELIGREAHVTREEADAFALRSHQRALAARERLAEEICPVFVPPKFDRAVEHDNGPRENQSLEALAKLRPVFERDTGTVTAGNASQVTDGAVALLVMTESRAAREGLAPLGVLTHYAYAGLDPKRMGLGPVYAIDRAEKSGAPGLHEADIVELNEAFAAQVLACQRALASDDFCRRELGRDGAIGAIPDEKLNVNGGAIALGHPVGASGARLVLTALRELRRRGGRRALATLCVGGGQGAALWLEAA
ncbi:MAG: acetyl-CoA C-acyltransferase [Acidobacteria bacterium]|nr:MAG: acetyl-CoA C-acyltransferase [Acidobacteriota bacterium]